MCEVNQEHYAMQRSTDPDPIEVDAEFVQRWLDAAPFFDALIEGEHDDPPVGEQHRQDADGTIRVHQVTPWGDSVVTTFTPLD